MPGSEPNMKDHDFYLTDELERQLVLAEMQAQFRPRPLKALANLFKRLAASLHRVRGARLKTQTA